MSKETSRQFEQLLSNYFEQALEGNPVWANSLGLKQGEGKLGDPGMWSRTRMERLRQDTLRQLDGMAVHELNADQQLDRLAIRSMLMAECEDFERGVHSLDPDGVDHVFGVLLHELQRGEDEPARARRNIESVLKEAPRFLRKASGIVVNPERVWRRIMVQSAAGADAMFGAVKAFMGDSSAKAIRRAQSAVVEYREAVMGKPLAPVNSFSLGSEKLQRRIRDELGLDYTLNEIESIALAEADRVGGVLAKACARYGRGKSVEQIIDEARANWSPDEALLDVYRNETDRVARGFKKAKAVSFPRGDELDVRLVPEFMRHLYPTAAYSSPGPFEKRQRGIFWVNDLSLTKTTPTEKLAEVQQHFGISLTAAHEAYPGHHLQFVTANAHARKWRPLFAHAVFYEGWTLWCEQMMTDLQIDRSPWTQIIQLHDALWRVHRILVDLRLQTGRYSFAQGVKHLMKHVSFTKARAEADVNWYTSSPGVPMSYWLGRLENARLHRRLVEGRGWSLKRFNDWLLSHGTLPQSWLEKYMLD